MDKENSPEMHNACKKGLQKCTHLLGKFKGREVYGKRAEGGLPLILKEKDCSKNGNNYMEKSSYVQLQTASCSGAISNKL